MNSKRIALFLACLVLTATGGYFVARRSPPADEQAVVLHTYDVPPDHAEEIKNVLNRVFATDKSDGNAQVFGNDILVVRAPRSYQYWISRLIADAGAQKYLPNQTIHLDYWLVRGDVAQQSNAASVPLIAPVLEAIDHEQGARRFTVLEHLGFTALDRRETHIKGAMSEIKAISRQVGDRIELDLQTNAKRGLGEIKVDTEVKPDEFVVLGENALQPKADDIAAGLITPDERRSAEVYHIIRAQIVR